MRSPAAGPAGGVGVATRVFCAATRPRNDVTLDWQEETEGEEEAAGWPFFFFFLVPSNSAWEEGHVSGQGR